MVNAFLGLSFSELCISYSNCQQAEIDRTTKAPLVLPDVSEAGKVVANVSSAILWVSSSNYRVFLISVEMRMGLSATP
jgi:hypothetical protein